ncbi:MAG: hypothetical protein P4L85_06590 [Paludisphaera borealis]|uniref:hypothetical protein n=1 Tax=Paludisphaera borealis TaxID=1387353 RepID=UPI002850CF75|nr:hypothetical protein [Paludisphaera borealis]MDR3619002.1 hypothetical protein [Paludisphaera borealis]
MSTVEEIERAIQQLPPEKLTELRAWFVAFDAEAWDQDLDEDVRAGLLDQLGDDALADLDEGRCSGL